MAGVMRVLRWLGREPLVHFLLAGALLYALFALRGTQEPTASREIRVDRAALLQFMQYRAKAFEPATFEAQFDALSPQQRQQLLDEYVREEALYREARALGLERGDYVMRQRLVQKMGFLLEDTAVPVPSEAQLQQYLDRNQQAYAVPPSWTFTHVFVDRAERGDARAEQVARRLQRTLNGSAARFNDAPRYSDRYPFLQNYVERTPDYIAGQFGAAFMAELEKLPVGSGQWLGPLRSEQGWHLVLVVARAPARIPTLAELHDQVADDFRRDRAAALQEQATQALVRSYHVRVGPLGRASR